MTEERKGQIALLFLKERLRSGGVSLSANINRDIGNQAKKIDISTEEATEFAEGLVRELVEELFPSRS